MAADDTDARGMLPLTHLTYHVLLALAGETLHGYGIIKEVSKRTDGRMEPETGTLYTAIRRLLDDGLIEESDRRPAPDEDQRRRYYALTPFGAEVLRLESERLAALVAVAREKRVLSPSPLGQSGG
jgi:DNA-binding PadR family transcriptional regulator